MEMQDFHANSFIFFVSFLGRESLNPCAFCLCLSSCGSSFSVTLTLWEQCWYELVNLYLTNEHEKEIFGFYQASYFTTADDNLQKAQIQQPISPAILSLGLFIS